MKLFKIRVLQFFLLLNLGYGAVAQNVTGRVTGTVATDKGEPLVGASIKASDTHSSEAYTIVSNDKGLFEFR
ncbi:MAG TPA: carboxypeptidase-like regulatory domain-containing protein, partial [Puia sp.]|nr:carboxypeptidase-like regulatory domain-containing protein [Puia sp.]